MWTDEQNTVLVAILDELIPGDDAAEIPGAGALGVADFLPTATSYAHDPTGAVMTVLKQIAGGAASFVDLPREAKITALKEAEAACPKAFATLIRLTYMGYYSRPDTRPIFGVGAHPIHPKGYDVPRESSALIDELTAPVRARGPMYRNG